MAAYEVRARNGSIPAREKPERFSHVLVSRPLYKKERKGGKERRKEGRKGMEGGRRKERRGKEKKKGEEKKNGMEWNGMERKGKRTSIKTFVYVEY